PWRSAVPPAWAGRCWRCPGLPRERRKGASHSSSGEALAGSWQGRQRPLPSSLSSDQRSVLEGPNCWRRGAAVGCQTPRYGPLGRGPSGARHLVTDTLVTGCQTPRYGYGHLVTPALPEQAVEMTEHGQRSQPGGLGPDHQGPERARPPAEVAQRLHLLSRQPAFGSHHQSHRSVPRGVAEPLAALLLVEDQQAHSGSERSRCFPQWPERRHVWHLGSARLPRRLLDDALPARVPGPQRFRLRARHRALRQDGPHPGHAELGRLLQHEVQLVSLRQALDEHHGSTNRAPSLVTEPQDRTRLVERLHFREPRPAPPVEDLHLLARDDPRDAKMVQGRPLDANALGCG